MKNKFKQFVSIYCIIFFLPFFMALLFNKNQVLMVSYELSEEDYLAAMVYLDLPKECLDYSSKNYKNMMEFIKAQIILTRTNYYFRLTKEEKQVVCKDAIELIKESLWNSELQRNLNAIDNVIKHNEKLVLKYHGTVVEVPFHRVSNGCTRYGVQVYQNNKYKYLIGVKSEADVKSKEYLKGYFFQPKQLFHILREKIPEAKVTVENIGNELKVIERDNANYILSIQVGDTFISGEEFRSLLCLSSSDFTVQSYEDGIRFLCKGLGHGLGLSQYGAMQLSLNNTSYKEILNRYFPNLEIDYL